MIPTSTSPPPKISTTYVPVTGSLVSDPLINAMFACMPHLNFYSKANSSDATMDKMAKRKPCPKERRAPEYGKLEYYRHEKRVGEDSRNDSSNSQREAPSQDIFHNKIPNKAQNPWHSGVLLEMENRSPGVSPNVVLLVAEEDEEYYASRDFSVESMSFDLDDTFDNRFAQASQIIRRNDSWSDESLGSEEDDGVVHRKRFWRSTA